MSKRLDFQQLANTHKFTVAHAQLYVEGLLKALTQPEPEAPALIVIFGVPQELICQDGTVSLRSFVLLETPEFRDWHGQTQKDIAQKLTYDANITATVAELETYSDARFAQLAQQAMKALTAPPRPARPRAAPADAASAEAPKTPKASGKSKQKAESQQGAPSGADQQQQGPQEHAAQGMPQDEAQREMAPA